MKNDFDVDEFKESIKKEFFKILKENNETDLNKQIEEQFKKYIEPLIKKQTKNILKISFEEIYFFLHFLEGINYLLNGLPYIIKICQEGKLQQFKKFIEEKDFFINFPIHDSIIKHCFEQSYMSKNHDRIIHLAVNEEQIPIVQYLIEEENVDVNITGYGGWTPFHYACEKGNLELVKYLYAHGANPLESDDEGKPPIKYTKSDEIIQYLESECGSMPDDFEPDIFEACRSGKLSSVAYLIRSGTDIEQSTDLGNRPLHLAVNYGKVDIVRFLVNQGAKKDVKNFNGETPYDLAWRNEEIRKILNRS